MYKNQQHLHFVGIGGVGMAAIAEVLINLGYSVSGSDIKKNHLCQHLESLGVDIQIGHRPSNLRADSTVLIYSSAVSEDNEELREARAREIPCIPRAEMLAEIMRMKYGIAVAGSHGKTSTTAMLGHLLAEAELDPTVIVGARILGRTSGARVGRGKFVVAESDESDGSFRLLKPAVAVVTNIDTEHLAFYGSFSELVSAFTEFVSSIPFYGVLVACFDDPVVEKLARGLKRRVVSYGFSDLAEVRATEVETNRTGSSYNLEISGEFKSRVNLALSGEHYVKNSLAAIAVALELGVSVEEAVSHLKSFVGVARRAEVISENSGITVVDDYAHHPTEIAATLKTIKTWLAGEEAKLHVIFEPHRYSRVKESFSEFVEVFNEADELYVTEVYSAGESPIAGADSRALAEAIKTRSVCHIENQDQLVERVLNNLESGDILLTVGAGVVGGVARRISEELACGTKKAANY